MTSFKTVEGNGERTGLLTPTPFGVNSSQSTPGGTSDLVGSGEGNDEFPVGRGSSGEEPYLLSWLDGLSFIPIPAGSTLEGPPDILLYLPERTMLVIFESADVLIRCGSHIRESAEHVQWHGRFSPVYTGERGDSGALMYCASEG